MLKRTVWKIEVDADVKAVRCYIRRLPLVNRATELMLGEVEKAGLTTDSRPPVRTLKAPGTPRLVHRKRSLARGRQDPARTRGGTSGRAEVPLSLNSDRFE